MRHYRQQQLSLLHNLTIQKAAQPYQIRLCCYLHKPVAQEQHSMEPYPELCCN